MTSPVAVEHDEVRQADWQLRLADTITAFAGRMEFVWIHAVLFVAWMALGVLTGFDKYPFGLLTVVVSLEAIFLATFVMIGQNRQGDFARRKADRDFHEQEQELRANTELTRAVHELVEAIHGQIIGGGG